jgi:hypothetical protein
MLRQVLRDDTILAEDTIDAELSTSITINDICEKATENIKKREKIIARLRSLNSNSYKDVINKTVLLFIAENEYLRTEKYALIKGVESDTAKTLSDSASQNFSELCDKLSRYDRYTIYSYRDSYYAAREQAQSAELESVSKQESYFVADDDRVLALRRWIKLEKDSQKVLGPYLQNRHVYSRLTDKKAKYKQRSAREIDKMARRMVNEILAESSESRPKKVLAKIDHKTK